jgi:hypothetical protein
METTKLKYPGSSGYNGLDKRRMESKLPPQ